MKRTGTRSAAGLPAVILMLLWGLSIFLTGCSGQDQPWIQAGVSEDFYHVTENFAGVYLAFDQDGQRYDRCLDAVQNYLNGSAEYSETRQLVEESSALFQQEADGFEQVVLEDELKEQLQNCGISSTEYAAFSNSRPSNLQTQIQRLNSLLFYLDYTETDDHSRQNLAFLLASDQAEQECMRGYYYYGCFNYWFAGASEKEKEYLQQTVTDQLNSYLPEDPVWYQTRENAEQCTMAYLDEMETIVARSALHLGEEQQALYDMQQDYEQLQAAIEEIRQARQTLTRLYYIQDQLEALEPQILAAKETDDQKRLDELEQKFRALVAEYEALTGSQKIS